jgi:hypothetical protein
MSRLERLLIPIIAVVIVAAFLLEGASPSTVRVIAIIAGILLLVALVYGMIRRARKKLKIDAEMRMLRQTSNDAEPKSPG